MFATLDPTLRAIALPSNRRVILSDTVGFIRNLPTMLIEAFRATLEEVADAALILHVVDISSDRAPRHVAEVFRVLGEIGTSSKSPDGAAATPQILVLNKADCLEPEERDASILGPRLLGEAGQSPLTPTVLVSGRTGEGLPALFRLIDQVVPFNAVENVRFRIPLKDGASIALLHQCGRVLTEDYHGNLCEMEVDAPESLRRRLSRYLIGKSALPVENSV